VSRFKYLIVSFLICIVVSLALSGCDIAQSVGQAERQTWGPSSVSPVVPTPTPTQEVQPTPTPAPSIGGWYEFSYSKEDYLQTTYTVFLDLDEGIEVVAGLHTWNDSAMHEHYCTNISGGETLIVNYPDATHVSLGITLDGYYSNETYTLDRGGFLTRRYVDAEGHIQLSVLSPTTEESYNSAIAALHAQAPDCTASDF